MQAATAGRYTCALIALFLLFQPVDQAPDPASVVDAAPFLNQALTEARVQRVLSGVQRVPAAPAAAAPAEESVSAGPTAAEVTPAPAPVTIVVREGQSLWSLAAQYGTSIEGIQEANGLAIGEVLRVGQELVIPGPGVATTAPTPRKTAARLKPGTRVVTIRLYEGQTLWDVSQTYGVSIDEIVELNGLSSPDYVRAGQRLKVPAREMASIAPRRVAQSLADSAVSVASSAAALAQGFIWPARGRLTSRFGWRRWRHHDGIDIAAPYGSPVTAARDGVVVFAGWYHAYGKALIVDHGSGLQTLYGHNSRLLVRSGERVTKGQLIAKVGSTGRSTGPHLHFEVRINGRPVNPIKYL
ncbi:MAG TPA: M23 family metallopeptidase [bacterium]|nr:M23 family metallopeptidase [bacterium]